MMLIWTNGDDYTSESEYFSESWKDYWKNGMKYERNRRIRVTPILGLNNGVDYNPIIDQESKNFFYKGPDG